MTQQTFRKILFVCENVQSFSDFVLLEIKWKLNKQLFLTLIPENYVNMLCVVSWMLCACVLHYTSFFFWHGYTYFPRHFPIL